MTVTGVDDEGTEDTDSGDHTIAVTDFAPVIDIEKTRPAEIDEGGEDVTWHFEITNYTVRPIRWRPSPSDGRPEICWRRRKLSMAARSSGFGRLV